MSLLNEIHNTFPMEEIKNKKSDIRDYSALSLAYLGDAFYEILIRTLVIERTGGPVKNFHTKSSTLVNAKAQADIANVLIEHLSDEELSAFKHGRNAKTSSVAKHADIKDYRNATGLESLFGYLYLTNNEERAIELLRLGINLLNIELQ